MFKLLVGEASDADGLPVFARVGAGAVERIELADELCTAEEDRRRRRHERVAASAQARAQGLLELGVRPAASVWRHIPARSVARGLRVLPEEARAQHHLHVALR